MKLNKVPARLSRFHFEILAVLWCTAAIAWVALHGLRAGYFPDDLMNLYQGWVKPWSSLALDLLLPSTESYRPTGALVLKLALLVFGLNPLPLRALCLLLIVLNMGLHFSVVRTLSRSNTTAALSICLFAFHACMSDLYLSSATIYDLLAFAFVHTGLLVYIRARENGNRVGWKRWAGIGACLLLASGAKEVGFVLPVLLIGYEVLWKRGEAWSGGGGG